MATKAIAHVNHDTGEIIEGQVTVDEAIADTRDELAELTRYLIDDGVNVQPSPLQIMKAIMGESTIDGADPELASKAIVARLLLAESADEVLAANEVTPAEMVLGANLRVHGVKWMPSSFGEGPQVYAIIDAENVANGDRKPISCGASNVLAQLLRLQVGNAFPVIVRIVQASRATARGHYPLWLEKGTEPAAQQPMAF